VHRGAGVGVSDPAPNRRRSDACRAHAHSHARSRQGAQHPLLLLMAIGTQLWPFLRFMPILDFSQSREAWPLFAPCHKRTLSKEFVTSMQSCFSHPGSAAIMVICHGAPNIVPSKTSRRSFPIAQHLYCDILLSQRVTRVQRPCLWTVIDL
jgi:hypothetical protein